MRCSRTINPRAFVTRVDIDKHAHVRIASGFAYFEQRSQKFLINGKHLNHVGWVRRHSTKILRLENTAQHLKVNALLYVNIRVTWYP